ncbi:hypothetical protein DIE23_35665 [Burkholderia sp. Bp9143]|uniref:hypothetical protein n=1 Tax=Burkholderia sp. Bp9143 TaxID=2184574 RepID=UPI000F5A35F7|nr:hypothetical protein [Burkholderia sp. Bp9143]RQR22923.1 hypothetical protein DIE23_35665 [Burkholderia sp. Bp9143]
MSELEKQDRVVSFTADQWLAEDETEAFGVRKIVPKKKEPTPGVKAILVFEDSFRRAKKHLKAYPLLRPQLDLPELISAMIDVCDADPAIMEKVARRIIDARRQQLDAMAASTTPPDA